MVWLWILGSIGLIILLESIFRGAGAPVIVRPSYILDLGGQLFQLIYYYLGKVIGWILYAIWSTARFIADRFWSSLVQTLTDLLEALKRYVDFYEFVRGFSEVLYAYWVAYSTPIIIGLVVLIIISGIGIAYVEGIHEIPVREEIGFFLATHYYLAIPLVIAIVLSMISWIYICLTAPAGIPQDPQRPPAPPRVATRSTTHS